MKSLQAMMLSVWFVVSGLTVGAATVYVATPANGGSDATGDGSAEKPYETVRLGLARLLEVDESGTLSVGEGTFAFTELETLRSAGVATGGSVLVLSTGVKIVGAGMNKTIFSAQIPTTVNNGMGGRLLSLNHKDAVVSDVTLRDCWSAEWHWTGLAAYVMAGTLQRVRVTANDASVAQFKYGVVALDGQDACLLDSQVDGNGLLRSTLWGGGTVYVKKGLVSGCVIFNNRVGDGGGLFIEEGARVRNCTVVNNVTFQMNTSKAYAGGIYVNSTKNVEIRNCIFFGNVGETDDGHGGSFQYAYPNGLAFSIDDCFLNCAFPDTARKLGNEAVFVSKDDFKNYDGGDYTMKANSPTVDAGSMWEGLGEVDFAGNPRVQNDIVDMGAYEADPNEFTAGIQVAEAVFLGRTAVASAVTPSSVASHALACSWRVSDAGGEIVAESSEPSVSFVPSGYGVYTISLRVEDQTTGKSSDATATTSVLPAVCYVTCRENAQSEAPWESSEKAATNLGEVVAAAVPGQTIVLDEGVHTVGDGTSYDAILLDKGITIRGAGIDRTFVEPMPKVKDQWTSYGRAFNLNHAQATVEKLTIRKGHGEDSWYNNPGGAGVIVRSGTLSECRVTECWYTQAQQLGGAVWLEGPGAKMVRCIVNSNGWAGAACQVYAGGVYVTGGATMEDCLIATNRSVRGGGIGVGANATVRNCTVVGNVAEFNSAYYDNNSKCYYSGLGGGIYVRTKSHNNPNTDMDTGIQVVNTVFAGNHAGQPNDTVGGEEYDMPTNVANKAVFMQTFSHCGFAAAAAVGEGSLAVADLDAVGFKDVDGGDFALDNHSPFYKKGVYQTWMDGAKDLAGNDRVVKFRKGTWLVDMGAYESPWVGPGFMLLLR